MFIERVYRPYRQVYDWGHSVSQTQFLVLLSCQPSVTVTSCYVYNVIRDLESIDHFCINPIHRIGLIHK